MTCDVDDFGMVSSPRELSTPHLTRIFGAPRTGDGSHARSYRVFASLLSGAVAGAGMVAALNQDWAMLAADGALVLGFGSLPTIARRSIAGWAASQRRSEAVMNSVDAYIYEFEHPSWQLRYMNEPTRQLLGDDAGSAAVALAQVVPQDRKLVHSELHEMFDGSPSRTFECRVMIRGVERWLWHRITLEHVDNTTLVRVCAVDVTARKVAELALQERMLIDELTGLPNRKWLKQQIDVLLLDDAEHSVMIVDLNRFKEINDAFGHAVGDALLIEVAARLQSDEGALARLGADEFAILLAETDQRTAQTFANRLSEQLRRPFFFDGIEISTSASIGIAGSLEVDHRSEELLRRADAALFRAKREGRHVVTFDSTVDAPAGFGLQRTAEVRAAIERGQLEVFYQPIVSIQQASRQPLASGVTWLPTERRTQRIVSCEALVRWRHPQRGLLGPNEFLPIAEAAGFMPDLSKSVVTSALRQLATWTRDGHRLSVSVNLSASNLADRAFVDWMAEAIDDAHIDPRYFTVELTETELLTDQRSTIESLSRLRALGVRAAVDDFGTGFSSLVWLRDLPIDALKIDRSFVDTMEADPRAEAIVKATIDLARNLGLVAIAEGIERNSTLQRLASFQCELAQGYFFSKPVTAAEMTVLLLSQHQRRSGSSQATAGAAV
jgi:diguanylate cyclase (GGDEF)-like protein